MHSLSHYYVGRANNFNLLRVVSASSVIVSHAYALALGIETNDFLAPYLPGYNLGRLAVWTFFIISGFFVSQSFERKSSFSDFCFARFLRLYPGLLISLFITAFLIGPLFTELPLREYLESTTPALYVVKNLLLRTPMVTLPKVFTHNPFPGVVNGSLWSLYYEVICYFLVVYVGSLTAHRRLFFIVSITVYFFLYGCVSWINHAVNIAHHIHTIRTPYLYETTLPFVMGMIFYRYRNYIPYHFIFALLAFAAMVWLRGNPYFIDIFVILWAYIVFYLGFFPSKWLLAYNKLGDYSYGIYIYSWPVMQMITASIPGISLGETIALAFPASVACGIVSWRLIEKPALSLRPKLAGYMQKVTQLAING